MDGNFSTLIPYLTTWTRRRRWRDALIWLPRGLLAGLLLAVVVATAARLRPFLTNQEVAWVSLGLAGLGLLVSAILLLAQRDDLPGQARFADRHFRLQERVRTAVDLHQGRIEAPAELVRQQLADTLVAIQRVDVKTALPLKLVGRDWLLLGVALILLATAVYLPNPQEEILIHNRAVAETIAQQVEALEELKEEIEENPDLSDELREELLAPIENALTRLDDGAISQEEALAALSEAEIDLRELAQANNLDSLQQSLTDAGQNAADSSLSEALQSEGLAETGAALSQLAAQLPSLTAEQVESLARDLAQTAANLENIDPELAQQLAEAAAALNADDLAAAQQALGEAAATLQERGQQAGAAQQAQAAANQLGEGRQEVAQAGTEGTNGEEGNGAGTNGGEAGGQNGEPGQNGSGDGNGNGQNGGPSSLTPGSDQAGAGGIGEGDGPSGVDVFVPDWSDLSQFEGMDIELPAECRLNPLLCGDVLSQWPSHMRPQGSQVPYADVYGNYRDAANQALDEDYIPLGMRGFIRDYFSSLEP
ncbi:MAG: hypothetical protein R6X32_06580 [Chloroflexota bacterium]